MFMIGDDGLARRGIESCGLAILLCLLFAPAALAQNSQTWHMVAKQTAPESLTLIKPSDPLFEGTLDTYFPGLSDAPAYKTSLRPFLVILRNDTDQTAAAYAITWTERYSDGSVHPLRTIYVNRPLTGRGGMTYLPPGDILLIAPMFNLTPKQYEQQRSALAKYSVQVYPWLPDLASVDATVDGVVYSGGRFIGPDKTGVLQRYIMARFAVRDEALAVLSLINSSTASPLPVVVRLEESFLKESQWSQKAYQRTLLALYVRARGNSAADFRLILQRRGLVGFQQVLQKFVNHSGGGTKPSMFGRAYKTLSPNDPRVFLVGPSPKEPLPLPAPAAGAPQEVTPFTLTIETPGQPLKAGKPMVLRVSTKNTGDGLVTMPMGGSDLGRIYQVHVLDAQGKPVPRRPPPPVPKPGSKQPFFAGGSAFSTRLEPGRSMTEKVSISNDYDLRPGKYEIWITEPIGPRPSDGLVKSNVISVTVVK